MALAPVCTDPCKLDAIPFKPGSATHVSVDASHSQWLTRILIQMPFSWARAGLRDPAMVFLGPSKTWRGVCVLPSRIEA